MRKRSLAGRIFKAIPNAELSRARHWNATAVAVAIGLGCLPVSSAWALGLGRVTVQSALGEPLRAEIDVPDITAVEAESLHTTVAAPEAFRTAGVDYNPIVSSVQISLQKRGNGSSYLKLTSDKTVNDPFFDLLLVVNWSSGRLVRDYTLLFDPAGSRPAPAPLAPQVPPSPAAAPMVPMAPAYTPPPQYTAPPSYAPPVAASQRPYRPEPRARQPRVAMPAPASGQTIRVKVGDTASRIAGSVLPAGVSLDQMMLAMLRSNPNAFVNGNVNRLRAGAVIHLPGEDAAAAIPPSEAARTIVAQSRDFNAFRHHLASNAPSAMLGDTKRSASGKVQTTVNDNKAGPAVADKLTLSKGAIQGKTTEDKIAKDRAAKDAADRAAELAKNISDLNKLGAGAAAASAPSKAGVAVAAGAVAAGAAAPALVAAVEKAASAAVAAKPASAPASAASVASVASAALPAAAPASAAVAKASAPAAAATSTASKPQTHTAAVTAKPLPEPSMLDTVMEMVTDNWQLLLGALAALLGLGALAYRLRGGKRGGPVDSSFLESRLQPDSFFGASGGQRINTKEASASGSSMVYSPSQLDAAGDVDPVAEADVYLAYGRDLQAEEILKEAMRINPSRVAIHTKLLEIYAKRRDAKAFEVIASEVYALTNGEGTDWEHTTELGRELDPNNPFYGPGGRPPSLPSGPVNRAAVAFADNTQPLSSLPGQHAHTGAGDLDLDLDLDFSASSGAPLIPPPTTSSTRPGELRANLPTPAASVVPAPAPMAAPTPKFVASAPAAMESLHPSIAPQVAPPTQAASPAPGMIEFDLDSLSLDLDPAKAAPAVGADLGSGGQDPLATKLALAREFHNIGDKAGAREIAEEVVQEASGAIKAQAQKFLSELA